MKLTSKTFKCLFIVILLMFAGSSFANVNWILEGEGNWFNEDNWDPGLPTDSTHTFIYADDALAVIDDATAHTLQFHVGQGAEGLRIVDGGVLRTNGWTSLGREGDVTFEMTGGTWTNLGTANPALHFGHEGTNKATADISGGLITGARVFINNDSVVNLSGDAKLSSGTPMRVGHGNLDNTATLNISENAEIDLGSHLYGAGAGGNAEINQSGGTFDINGSFQAGNTSDAEFTYNLSGGELNHTHHEFYFGNDTGVTAKINISGGKLETTADLQQMPRDNATAHLTVSGGRLVAHENVRFNSDAEGGEGVFTVSGSGATEITIGERLAVTNGHTLAFELDSGGITRIDTGNWVNLQGANITLDALAGFAAELGDEFELVYTADDINGIVGDGDTIYDASAADAALDPGLWFEFVITDLGEDAGSILSAEVVPEPATLGLLGFGAVIATWYRKRK